MNRSPCSVVSDIEIVAVVPLLGGDEAAIPGKRPVHLNQSHRHAEDEDFRLSECARDHAGSTPIQSGRRRGSVFALALLDICCIL